MLITPVHTVDDPVTLRSLLDHALTVQARERLGVGTLRTLLFVAVPVEAVGLPVTPQGTVDALDTAAFEFSCVAFDCRGSIE